jgi:hypothetical protein
MNEKHEVDIQKLLALKKFEGPGRPYFDNFLSEFHRYQRMEILAKPTWQERLSAWFAENVSVTSPRFALASAACLAVAASAWVLLPGEANDQGSALMASGDSVVAPVSGGRPGFYPASLHYADRNYQQPEIQKSVSSFERDFASPRYVTGENAGAYEANLAF